MGGISFYTVMVVQGNYGKDPETGEYYDDIKADAAGPDKDGKYTGWISKYNPDGTFHCALLDSGPAYDSAESAIEGMKKLIVEIRGYKIGEE